MKKERRIFSMALVISMIATFLVSAIPMGALQPKDEFVEHNGSYVDFVTARLPDNCSDQIGLIRLEDGLQGKQPFVLIYNDDNAEPAFSVFYEEVIEGRFKAARLNFTVGEHNTKMFVMTPESVYYIAQNYTVENGEEEIEIIKGNEQGIWLIPEAETPE